MPACGMLTDFLCLLWSSLFFLWSWLPLWHWLVGLPILVIDSVLLRTVLNESYFAFAFMSQVWLSRGIGGLWHLTFFLFLEILVWRTNLLRKIEDFAAACRRPRREAAYPRSCRPPLSGVSRERETIGRKKDSEWIPNSRTRVKKGKDFLGSHGIMHDTSVLVQIINTWRSQKPSTDNPFGKDLQFLFALFCLKSFFLRSHSQGRMTAKSTCKRQRK
jgi:hypothetical protein